MRRIAGPLGWPGWSSFTLISDSPEGLLQILNREPGGVGAMLAR